MVAFGQRLGQALTCGTVFLEGNLGAGKTTLCRGIVRSRGYSGAVKSPTYTLVEPYQLPAGSIYHFDLYRLNDPEELEFMGIRDYFDRDNLCVVEWPEKGQGFLPEPDLVVAIEVEGAGRKLTIMALTPSGDAVLDILGNETDKS
ncbi:MAG: tRNA (adenosine(37)-N6)-threonylcarbamoyltransferase complex ATPase subunit type 1 TsaE [Porticoccaceae bacterium]